jgi:broad specificity phosphatase PhoE
VAEIQVAESPTAGAPAREVVLLRHGATEWSASGRHTGRTDVPLTADGERQAALLRPRLAGLSIGLVLASPLQRAQRTAELAGLTGIETDPDLMEWDYGAYEGLTSTQIGEQHSGWVLWRDGVAAGDAEHPGETSADVGHRVDRVIARALAALHDGDVVLVAHGHLLRVLAARWLGLAADAGAFFGLDTASYSALGFEHGLRVIRRWNVLPPSAS